MQNYPFLSDKEFGQACLSFADRYGSTRQCVTWGSLKLVNNCEESRLSDEPSLDNLYINIIRTLPAGRTPTANEAIERTLLPDVVEEDLYSEVVPRQEPHCLGPVISYDILLSPSYRVPVLYFSITGASDVSDVLSLVVPPEWTSTVQNTGVLGAISQGDHPLTLMPAYFVHPCNTSNAMQELGRSLDTRLENYIQIWLGLIGGCVGLRLPY